MAARGSRLTSAFTALVAGVIGAVTLPAPASAASMDCAHPAGVAINRFVPFRNRFGETIAVDLYLPAGGDGAALTERGCRYPVVLESSPYRDWITPQPAKVDGGDDARRTWWVRRGYVYAFADVPGSGGSDGAWCFWCRHEQLSGVDMVNALGRQRWSNGRVGMIGGSYPAINALLVAQHRPEHLKAVIAAAFFLEPYSDFFYVGGLRRGEDAASLMAAFTGLSRWTGRYSVPTSQADASRFLEVWSRRETAPPPEFLSIQDEHPTRDAWYEERTIHPERIAVPVYILGGWNDIFDRATWRAFDRLGSRVKTLIQGPFTHVPLFMPPGAWPCPSQNSDFCGAPLFDRFLKGVDSTAYQKLVATPVRTYVQPAGNSAKVPYIASSGKPKTYPWELRLAESGTAVVHYQPAAGTTSGRWFYRGSVAGGQLPYDAYLGIDNAQDQRLEERTSLSLVSAPLQRSVTMLGAGRLSLRVTANATDADVVVRVVDEYPPGSPFPAGYGTVVTNGWLKASHRNGHSSKSIAPLTPGRPTRLDVEIWPAGYRFAKGHRIRIDIYPSDVPRFMPPTTPVDLTVDLGASRATFPTLEDARSLTLGHE
jgi:hypothetical protein